MSLPRSRLLVSFVLAFTASAQNSFDHAKELVMHGQFAAATDELEQLVRSSPDSPVIYNLLGYCYVQQHESELAEQAFRKAIALDPSLKPPRRNLAGIYLLEGKLQDGINELSILIRLDPADPQALSDLGRAELAAGDAKSALPHLELARELRPADTSLAESLAHAYETVGDDAVRSGHGDQAILAFQKAMDLDPGNQDYVLELAQVLLANYNAPAAVALLDPAVKAFPNSARVWFTLGVADLLNENLNAAEPALKTSLGLDPKLDLAYVVLGQGYLDAGRWNDLLQTAHELIALNPQNAAGYYYQGKVLLQTGYADRSQAEVQALLAKAVSLDPDNPDARYELAKLLLNNGENQRALSELETIVRTNPDFGQAYYQLSRLYRAAGQVEKSQAAQQQFERLRTKRGEAVRKLVVEIRRPLHTPP
jgi:predicted Zn-dependent protease